MSNEPKGGTEVSEPIAPLGTRTESAAELADHTSRCGTSPMPTGAGAWGHEEIEARVASASEHWVGSEGVSFRRRHDAERLGDVLKFHWEGLDKDGELFAVGLHVLVLAADGRIERDYTFVG